ncbi:MAG: PaaI family thioesterase [Thermoguttaceae bacterium]
MDYAEYQRFRDEQHPKCVVCSPDNPQGLGVVFHFDAEGGVEGSFACDERFQGYPATVHGGIVSALLDAAMTNCLFAHGYAAVTFELNIRFRHSVATGKPAAVRARLISSSEQIHELAAELIQDGQVKATAKAKFLERAAAGLFGRKP